jgi:hypothetical protein
MEIRMINSQSILAIIPAWVGTGLTTTLALAGSALALLSALITIAYTIYKWKKDREIYKKRIKILNKRLDDEVD